MLLPRRLILGFSPRFPARRFCSHAQLHKIIQELTIVSRQQPSRLFASAGNQDLSQATPSSSVLLHSIVDRKIEKHEATFQEIANHMNLMKKLDFAIFQAVSDPNFDNKQISTFLSLFHLRATIQPPIYHHEAHLETMVLAKLSKCVNQFSFREIALCFQALHLNRPNLFSSPHEKSQALLNDLTDLFFSLKDQPITDPHSFFDAFDQVLLFYPQTEMTKADKAALTTILCNLPSQLSTTSENIRWFSIARKMHLYVDLANGEDSPHYAPYRKVFDVLETDLELTLQHPLKPLLLQELRLVAMELEAHPSRTSYSIESEDPINRWLGEIFELQFKFEHPAQSATTDVFAHFMFFTMTAVMVYASGACIYYYFYPDARPPRKEEEDEFEPRVRMWKFIMDRLPTLPP